MSALRHTTSLLRAVAPTLSRRLAVSASAAPPPSTPSSSAANTSTSTSTVSTSPTPPSPIFPPSSERGLGTVRDVLRTKGEKFFYTRADAFVTDAAREMVRHDIGSLIIVDGPARLPVGIVTETDYLHKVIVSRRDTHRMRVGEIMSDKPLAVVTADATLTECMELMAQRRIRHVPVVERGSGRVLGMVSVGDIVKELVAAHRKNAEHLQSFITGSY